MANHMAVAYRHRATQLTKWKRLRDFISLGVAPGLLCATFVWESVDRLEAISSESVSNYQQLLLTKYRQQGLEL